MENHNVHVVLPRSGLPSIARLVYWVKPATFCTGAMNYVQRTVHRPHQGPQTGRQESMQIDGVWCASSQNWPLVREIPGENPADIHPLISDFWACGVMNIINGITRGASPCVQAPLSLAAEERMLWERSTYKCDVR